MERGVVQTRWRGRLERINVHGKSIWIDGLHNAHAAAAVAPFIDKNVASPRLLVFGIMRDKDIEAVARILFSRFDRVIMTEPYPPRSANAEELAAVALRMNVESAAEPQPARAFELAMRSPQRSVFIGGSLYLAGAAIEYFDAQRKRSNKKQK
ncbi:MAG: hypothetical protein DMF58_10250 [Acidobacteria bacterium]|nr:MAG: hypothetical protein DMF58_10250 [Acidobacteriota bacterium]